jgi:hypothetical protein
MGFDGWALASMGSLMSSLSTRATRLATVRLAILAVLLSTALPVWATGSSAPLKPGVQQPATIVMAHVSSAVKEMYLDSLAVALAAEGLRALAFENRNFGASDGEARQKIGPWAQVRDCRRAITCAQAHPEADVDRIKVWGSSYSGGDVLGLGAIGERVECAAARAPLVSGTRNRQDFLASNRAAIQPGRAARFRGEPPAMVPLAGPDPMAVSALPALVTGSSGTWARHGRDDESQELSGGGESHVS